MIRAQGGVEESSFSAIVTRADGTVEDLGMIAYYNRDPIKLLIWKLKNFIKQLGV